MKRRRARKGMTRRQLLAAEVFSYSFANYHDHLGIGNARFDRLMPDDVRLLERAVTEEWPLAKLAEKLDTDEEGARSSLEKFERAVAVVDAENPAEAFRNAVRFVVRDAAEERLSNDEAIERLVIQICYRAADLAYLLDLEGETLSRYSRHLRREPDVEYYDGFFEEEGEEEEDGGDQGDGGDWGASGNGDGGSDEDDADLD